MHVCLDRRTSEHELTIRAKFSTVQDSKGMRGRGGGGAESRCDHDYYLYRNLLITPPALTNNKGYANVKYCSDN